VKHSGNKDSKIIVTVDKMEMSNLQTVPMATLREDTLQFQIINPAFFLSFLNICIRKQNDYFRI